jgi:outer membrane protein OmpA-like peptidoglycan-associated protein
MKQMQSSRQSWILSTFLVVLMMLLTAGCASTPAPSADTSAREESLRSLGFERTDDGYVLNLPGPLLFETGSDVLSPGAVARLSKLAADLRAISIDRLRLFGHTDNIGSADFNRALSTRRAEAVAQAMASNGFALDRLERRGFGFDRPLAGNDTAEGRAKNRRVSVIVPFE